MSPVGFILSPTSIWKSTEYTIFFKNWWIHCWAFTYFTHYVHNPTYLYIAFQKEHIYIWKNIFEKSHWPVLFWVQLQYENQLNILSSLKIGGFIVEHLHILHITHITQRVCIQPLKKSITSWYYQSYVHVR